MRYEIACNNECHLSCNFPGTGSQRLRPHVTETLLTGQNASELPPILRGQITTEVEEQVRHFVFSVAGIYQTWLGRRTSPHTRRAYDQDVMHFVRGYLRLEWPERASELLRVSV